LNFLFVHQNFPGQYRHLARYLADQPGNSVYFITQANGNDMRGVAKITYRPGFPASSNCHPFAFDIDRAIRTGAVVAATCRRLLDQGIRPDIVIGHNGWGETLFVKDVFPDVPLLSYFEFYYHAHGADMDFDPEFASVFADPAQLRVRNAINLIGFEAADWGHTATCWQRGLYPARMQRRITAIHEGVDTDTVKPEPQAWLSLRDRGLSLSRNDEIVTYVARNLEPYRGFHIFMRALPEILRRRPRAHILIVGGDGVSYGTAPPQSPSYREWLLREIGDRLDLARVHFLGQIPYEFYLRVLQVSSVHVYLTYPFVLSWSFIEAMAAGCLVIGSATPPVLEVLHDGVNGLTVDFFATRALADRIDEVLDHPDRMRRVRLAARRTAIAKFDLKRRQLPRWLNLIDDLQIGARSRLGFRRQVRALLVDGTRQPRGGMHGSSAPPRPHQGGSVGAGSEGASPAAGAVGRSASASRADA
jgi:glycosyltransferase involved in cell wall biosynthesis